MREHIVRDVREREPFGRTLQAAVTWKSVAGTTYYVQIGGFAQDFRYGNLRVAAS